MSIAVKSGLPSLGSTEGAVITKDDISVTEETSPSASVGEDLPRGKSAYEIAKENGFNGTEAEWLASLKGEPGAAGADGKDGTDGKTPYVGDNGNWYIGADDTGKPSRGAKGEPGQDGVTPTFSIESVETGEPGTDADVTMTGDAPNHGLKFVIPRGNKGEPGSPGAKGDKGDPGATPNLTIGTVTTLEAGQNATASMGGTAESPVLNLGIPRGAKGEPGQGGSVDIVTSVSASSTDSEVPSAKCVYDELQKRNLKQATSEALGGVKADPATANDTQPVRIGNDGKLVTAAGKSDISLGLTSATVGQTIKVKAIDESGKPTAWEAADMPSGGGGGSSIGPYRFIQTVTIPDGENVSIVDITIPAKTRKLYVLGKTNTGSVFGTTVRTNVRNGNIVFASLDLDKTMSHRNALFCAELYDDIQFMSFASSNAEFNVGYPGYTTFKDYASYFAKENNFFRIMIKSGSSTNQYFAAGCTFDLYAACEE